MGAEYISEIIFDGQTDENSYLNQLPIIKHLSKESIKLNSPVTVLVGENGTGKSTLLEAVAVAFGFNAEGGTRSFNFSTMATHSELYKHISLKKRDFAKDGFFLRAESLYNVATDIERMDSTPSFDPPVIEAYGGVSLHEQSHGESFLAIVQNRFFGNGLYILDEPESALSPTRILTLLAEINRLIEKKSQFLIATHSPIIMAFPKAQVLELSKNGIAEIDYRKSEHFKTYKSFFDDPDRMLHYLLNSK